MTHPTSKTHRPRSARSARFFRAALLLSATFGVYACATPIESDDMLDEPAVESEPVAEAQQALVGDSCGGVIYPVTCHPGLAEVLHHGYRTLERHLSQPPERQAELRRMWPCVLGSFGVLERAMHVLGLVPDLLPRQRLLQSDDQPLQLRGLWQRMRLRKSVPSGRMRTLTSSPPIQGESNALWNPLPELRQALRDPLPDLRQALRTPCQKFGRPCGTPCQSFGRRSCTHCQSFGRRSGTHCQNWGRRSGTRCQKLARGSGGTPKTSAGAPERRPEKVQNGPGSR
jgi:hypothetical protein